VSEPAGFVSIAGELRHEMEKVKGSRFIASAAPVGDAAEALAFVERLRADFPDSRHTCWAYRVGVLGDEFRYSDDGEPSGSAGKPIDRELTGAGLTCVALGVTRYFGGTKLGVGGLMRAYGGAAKEVLLLAEKRRLLLCADVRVEHPYECSGAVQGALVALGLETYDPSYEAAVEFGLRVPLARLEEVLGELRERCAGRATIEVGATKAREEA